MKKIMAIIDVFVGKIKYQIDCSDGEEDKISRLVEKLNQRIDHLTKSIPDLDERTKLMFCSLMVEEELESAKLGSKFDEIEENLSGRISEEELHHSLAENMKNMAVNIEMLVKKIEAF